MNQNQFHDYLASNAYGPAKSVNYQPNTSNEMHTHEFSACLLIVEGALTLTTETGSVTHRPGDTCEVSAGTLHSEKTGVEGVTFLAGRK
tara:strand:+ start:102 stop:368 length:267 start_codon:yes stop_codon:yes gene_type:complete